MNHHESRCDKSNSVAEHFEEAGESGGSLLRHPRCEGCNLTMLDWNKRQRALIADKVFDFGNVAAGGMVFGQFVAQRSFSIVLGISGLVLWVLCFVVSVRFEGERQP